MTLEDYYARLGLPPDAWHVGPEHPSLEELGVRLLGVTRQARILEIGVQSGGFAVPVILEMANRAGFSYTGVDSLDYTNAVPLKLVAGYLASRGVTEHLRFIEGDSTAALRTLAARSYDLILLDHYKPKYPLDLFEICARDLLSGDGAIVLHDTMAHAAAAWKVCERVCRAFGYRWTMDTDVVNGAAIVRRGADEDRSNARVAAIGVEVKARWLLHATAVRGRRGAGRLLRRAGLRT
jgi:predicted O-methyltransferase YrrM